MRVKTHFAWKLLHLQQFFNARVRTQILRRLSCGVEVKNSLLCFCLASSDGVTDKQALNRSTGNIWRLREPYGPNVVELVNVCLTEKRK